LLRKLIARALNRNQKLILFSIINGEKESLYSVLMRLSFRHGIALSTLKMNARILRGLDLISFNGHVGLTSSGEFVKNIMGDKNER